MAKLTETVMGTPGRTVMLSSAVLATIAFMIARNTAAGVYLPWFTAAASTGFVVLAAARGALGGAYGRFILLGLVGCWCGDMLGPRNFLAGLAAFLLAHFGFIGAFCANGILWKRMLWTLPVLATIDTLLLAWLLPHVPAREFGAVAVYMAVISLMVLFAFGSSHNAVGRRALMGALLFFVSDIFVARWRYVDPSPVNGNICYPVYYAACIVLALSVATALHKRSMVSTES